MPLFKRSNNFSETTLFTYKLNVRNLVGSIYKAVVSIQVEIYCSVNSICSKRCGRNWMEAGYEYVNNLDDVKLFRKRK
jgi:hypothetical protein